MTLKCPSRYLRAHASRVVLAIHVARAPCVVLVTALAHASVMVLADGMARAGSCGARA